MSHKEYLKKVGLEIRIARMRSGKTRAELVKSTGITLNAIGAIERGRHDTRILSYKRICDAIGISIKDIL